MRVGRALLVSALVHGGLLLAPIPDPGSAVPEAPSEAPLVWIQVDAPPAPRVVAAARVQTPAAVAPSTGTDLPARAVRAAQAHAAAAPPTTRSRSQAAPVELPDGAGADHAPGHGDGPAVPARAIPGLASPGALLPGPVAIPGQMSRDAPAAPAFDARAYGERIRRRIDAHKRYPARARRLGLAGVAVVIVAVDARGHLARPPSIAGSSGVAALDHEALRMARAAAPFPPPAIPDARPEPLVVHVPVRFSLGDQP